MNLNLKKAVFSLAAIFALTAVAGGISAGRQPVLPATSSVAQAAHGHGHSMPNEDPLPIAQDLERKLKDTGAIARAGQWANAKLVAAAALKTRDRLLVHITDTRLNQELQQSVQEAHDAVLASDKTAVEAKVAAALQVLAEAKAQLQNHTHS
ncbi:hypothetical protein [Acetonema longum]|uniref:Uncharacterized protein n=1 Tax=Acetonema longum DSM 6540 TaxID=1009370 RepID=F7NGM8_9FIRM|nr:hypothetical protein [Acetonema longum]EGO64832.1 hypothetical protein ALO_06080 [Acetonema longum DSM 6540]